MDFDQRIAHLSREVGVGWITAGCTVNQPYAQNQHQSLWFEHPHGGRALYLGGPLMENAYLLLAEVAHSVITPMGSDLEDQMVDIAEWMAMQVLQHAPRETGQLATSGNPWVKDNGVLKYDRPPLSPREAD